MVENNSEQSLHCKTCGHNKPVADFGLRERNRKTPLCRACGSASHFKYWRRNRERINQKRRNRTKYDQSYNRNYNLRALYGITLKQWNEMFEAQGNKCAICHTDTPSGRGWQTDHDHKTGRIRGILCHHCNSMIGHAMENINTLKQAMQYLETPSRTTQ